MYYTRNIEQWPAAVLLSLLVAIIGCGDQSAESRADIRQVVATQETLRDVTRASGDGEAVQAAKAGPSLVVPVPARPPEEVIELEAPRQQWSIHEHLSIGGHNVPEPYLFSYVKAGFFLGDNRIVIVDDPLLNVRFFDAEGRHRTTIGGRGQGPGEFQRMTDVTLLNDTVYVYDRPNRRITAISPNESVARTQIIDLQRTRAEAPLRIVGRMSNGSLILTQPEEEAAVSGHRRDTATIIVWNGARVTDTLALVPANEELRTISYRNGAQSMMQHKMFLANSALNAMHGEAVIAASSDRYELVRLIPGGDYSLLTRSDVPARMLNRGDLEKAMRDTIERRGDVPAETKESWEKVISTLPLRSRPIIDGLIIGTDGTVWIRDAPATLTQNRWTVYAANWQTLALVDLPANMKLLSAASDRVLLRAVDSLGVHQVIVASIRKP